MESSKTSLIFKKTVLIVVLCLLFIAVLIIQLFSAFPGFPGFFIRLLALWGYIMLAVAAIMTPFLKEVYKYFGKPFIKIHHIFAFSGLAFITLHPVFLAFQAASASVFIPVFSSWYDFWLFAGRPALIILYIALIAVLLRKRFKIWRIIHILMYVMLLFGFIHALLIGTDFNNTAIIIIYSLLFAIVVLSFALKRFRLYKSARARKT